MWQGNRVSVVFPAYNEEAGIAAAVGDFGSLEGGVQNGLWTWALSGDHVVDPYGVAWPIHLQLPGRANKSNDQ